MKAITGLAGLLVVIVPILAHAGTKLDDSLSPRQRFDIRSRWLHEDGAQESPDRLNALVAEIPGMEVRLNTAGLVGKRVRIYLVLPAFIQGMRAATGMRVEWKARGVFQSGAVAPGARAVLFEGTVTGPVTGDTLDVSIFLDARHVEPSVRFDPVYEFDEIR